MSALASSNDFSGSNDFNPLVTAIQIGNTQTAAIADAIARFFPSEGALATKLAITSTFVSTGKLVTIGPGYLIDVSVLQGSTGTDVGLIYDSATTTVSSFINAMTTIPSSTGFYNRPFPFFNGLVVFPSTVSAAQTVSVSYRQ